MKLGKKYDSGKFNNILESIEHSKSNKFLIENTSEIYNYNDTITLFSPHIFNIYKNLLSVYMDTITLDEKYFYKPELLSFDIYGTPDLWYLILWANDISTVTEFSKSEIKVINDKGLDKINTVIEAYKSRLNLNHEDPYVISDSTLKKI